MSKKIKVKINENFYYTIEQKKSHDNKMAIMKLYWNDENELSKANDISNLLPSYDPDIEGSCVADTIDDPMEVAKLITDHFTGTATITSNARYKDLIQGCRKLYDAFGKEPNQLINRLDRGTVDILIIQDFNDKGPKSGTYLFNVPAPEGFNPMAHYPEELRQPKGLIKSIKTNMFSAPFAPADFDGE